MKQYTLPLVAAEQLTPDTHKFTVQCAELVSAARPGQFLHVSCGDGATLRRPISIYDIDHAANRLSFIFQTRGKGTEWLAKRNSGDCINMLAPLGNGFQIPDSTRNIMVIGGGIGVFPLYALLKNSAAIHKTALLGFASSDKIVCHDEFEAACDNLITCTDDGSFGFHGNVATKLEQLISHPPDIICACGPKPMLKAIAAIAAHQAIPCQVSLEERMACGIGACLVCACKTKPQSKTSDFTYSHVCKDGPVFDAQEVLWDE